MSRRSDHTLGWRAILSAVVVAATALVVLVVIVQPANRAHGMLIPRHLQTPTFTPPPPVPPLGETIARVWSDLRSRAGSQFLQSVLPTQSGALWIALIVALVVAFDTASPLSPRNVELVSLLIVGFLLFDVLRFFDYLTDPTYFRVMDWVFTGVVATSLWLAGRALWRVWRPHRLPWQPNLPTRTLVLLTLVLLTLNALVVVVRDPDDAGFYTNLGGQRLRERGMFPYGDPLLSGSPGAAYGPVLFLSHLPFQWALDPQPVNPQSPDRPLQPDDVYRLPPTQATQLATLAYHLIGVAALLLVARRLANEQVAWALAAVYCGSAYVMGVGGPREMIGGLTFISHTAAPALALVAFACLPRPLLAGVFLALSVATVFYPLFLIPAWIGYYWRQPRAVLKFAGGIALAAIIVGGPVLAFSRPIEGHSLIGTIVRETIGHHQSGAYGVTPFGFWGGRGGVRAWLQQELVPGQATTTPMFLVAAVVAAIAFVPARRATPQQLALLSGASIILVDIWKILGTGVYVTWYYAFLLIGFFASGRSPSSEPAALDVSNDPSSV
jgi:hypothetical protein